MRTEIPSVHEDPSYDGRLVDIFRPKDVPLLWKDTPIEQLILAQNFHFPIATNDGKPKLLITTCIEFRYAMPVPRMYSYVIRRAGGRLVGSEFSLAYVLSRGVKHVALIGHNDCGMTKVWEAAPQMVEALVKQGWDRKQAEDFIERHAERYSVQDELDALKQEYERLRKLFKDVMIAPLFVSLADNNFHIPRWFMDSLVDGREPDNSGPVAEELLVKL